MFNKNIKSFFGNKKKLLFLNVTFVVAVVFVLSTFVLPVEKVYSAGAPTIINHQGRLLDSSGNLLGGAGGTNYCFRFSFYDDSTVGSPDNRLWPTPTPQKMTVNVKNGIFNVGIGDTSVGGDTLNYDFNSTSDTYLNIEVANSSGGSCVGVSSFETLSPRQRIASSGYALNSNAVGGFTPAQSATGNQIPVLTGGNLTLGATNAGLSATGTNALTFQSGVTGDLQFFSNLNKLTASGDLTIAGKATTTGLSLNLGSDATGDVYYRNGSGNFQRPLETTNA